jgi:hypothetical protein
LLWAVLTVAVLTSQAFAAGPAIMNYQGRLTDLSGVPVNGVFQVTFSIYDDSLIAFAPWRETHQVTCSDGLFDVVLGTTTAFPSYIFGYPALYMGIKLESDPEMLPRKRINSTLFAMRVESLDRATGGWVSGELTVENASTSNTAVRGLGGLQGGVFQATQTSGIAVALTGLYPVFGVAVDAIGVKGESTV